MIFKDFNMTDDEVMQIINQYEGLINKYSRINGKVDEDLIQEIKIQIYITLTKNREKYKKNIKNFQKSVAMWKLLRTFISERGEEYV